jgi:AcrR family transcriptional regulator
MVMMPVSPRRAPKETSSEQPAPSVSLDVQAAGMALRNPETRRQILIAAATLFCEKGYKATTLRDIAKVNGMGLGSTYYYFTSKEDILREVLDSGQISILDSVSKAVASLPSSASALDRLREAIRAHLNSTLESDQARTYWRVYNQLPPNMRRDHNPRRNEYFAFWRKLVTEVLSAGMAPADLHVPTYVDFLIGALGRATEWYNPDVVEIAQLARWIEGWILDGIRMRA